CRAMRRKAAAVRSVPTTTIAMKTKTGTPAFTTSFSTATPDAREADDPRVSRRPSSELRTKTRFYLILAGRTKPSGDVIGPDRPPARLERRAAFPHAEGTSALGVALSGLIDRGVSGPLRFRAQRSAGYFVSGTNRTHTGDPTSIRLPVGVSSPVS